MTTKTPFRNQSGTEFFPKYIIGKISLTLLNDIFRTELNHFDGKFSIHLKQWKNLTSDSGILSIVSVMHIMIPENIFAMILLSSH